MTTSNQDLAVLSELSTTLHTPSPGQRVSSQNSTQLSIMCIFNESGWLSIRELINELTWRNTECKQREIYAYIHQTNLNISFRRSLSTHQNRMINTMEDKVTHTHTQATMTSVSQYLLNLGSLWNFTSEVDHLSKIFVCVCAFMHKGTHSKPVVSHTMRGTIHAFTAWLPCHTPGWNRHHPYAYVMVCWQGCVRMCVCVRVFGYAWT